MTRLAALAVLIALGTACASASELRTDVDTGFNPTGLDTATEDTDVPPDLQGDWISVSGTLEIVDAAPVPDSVLTLQVQRTDAEGTLLTVDCGATLIGPLDAVAQVEDEVTLYGNWRFGIEPGTCIGLAADFELGLGPLHPALWPSAESNGVSIKHTRGVYTPTPDRTGLNVFGIAGTPDQIAGQGTPASLEPLPDGRYRIESAYLLAL